MSSPVGRCEQLDRMNEERNTTTTARRKKEECFSMQTIYLFPQTSGDESLSVSVVLKRTFLHATEPTTREPKTLLTLKESTIESGQN